MKKILVPSDLSDIAEEGLKMAVKLAAKLDAEISLVNFFQTPARTTTFFNQERIYAKNKATDVTHGIEMVRKNQSGLALLASHYAQQGVPVRFDIVNKSFKEGMAGYIRENDIDLVVMGTDPDIIVIALDKKSISYLGIYQETLREIVEPVCSKAYVLYMINPTERVGSQEIDKIETFSKSFEDTWSGYHLVMDNDHEKSLAEFARGKKAGIISIITYVKNGFFEVINDAFAKRILAGTKISVMQINANTKKK